MTNKRGAPTLEADDLVKELQRMGSVKGIEGMARFGIKGSQIPGVSVSHIRTLAKITGTTWCGAPAT